MKPQYIVILVLMRSNFVAALLDNFTHEPYALIPQPSQEISVNEPDPSSIQDSLFHGSFTVGNETCQLETLSSNNWNHLYSVGPFLTDNGDTLKLAVKFRGDSDGHIVLSTTLVDDGLTYLIVLGGYENKISEIRKNSTNYRSNGEVIVFELKTPEILSVNQFREFLVLYKKSKGELIVFPAKSHMPLLHWIDPQPLEINYFGFHSYHKKVILAAFNCHDSHEFSALPAFTPEPLLTPGTRGALLSNYDRQILPFATSENSEANSSAVTVHVVSLIITHFKLDNGILELHCRMELTWRDDRLSLKDNETGNNETEQSSSYSEKMHFSHEQIWVPDIQALNRGPYVSSITNPDQFPLYYKKDFVHWKLSARFTVPCPMDLRRWPKDNQKCSLEIGSWKYSPSELTFQLGTVIDGEVSDLKLMWKNDKTKSEMRVLSVNVELISAEESGAFLEEGEGGNESLISVRLGFQRRSSIYSYTVSLPIILISILNLGMFLVPLDIYERSIMSAFNFLVLSIYLIFFRLKLPDVDHIPYIVIVYGWNLILSTLNILSQAFLPRLGELVGSKSPPQCLSHIYNPSFMTVLGLGHLGTPRTSTSSPPTVAVVRSLYKRNSSNRSSDESELPRPNAEEPPIRISSWGLFAACINRISFVAYTTITLVLLACLM